MTSPAPLILPPGVDLPPLARLFKAATDQQSARANDATLKLTAGMMAGDLWQAGTGWNGPLPMPGPGQSNTDVARVSGEIERTFVSRNLPRDIVRRHGHGVAGREPLWNLLPRRILKKGEELRADEQAFIDEATGALVDWWEESGAWAAICSALATALSLKRATVRVFIHRDATVEESDGQGGTVRVIPAGLSLSEAARRISVHAPTWDQAGVVRDLDGKVTGGYFTRQETPTQTRWEIHERVSEGGRLLTRVHPWATGSGTDLEPPADYPVPDLLVYELELPTLITDSVQRLAKMANKILMMGSRNVDLGGFLERTILGAEMPGEWQKGADGKEKFVPRTYNVGPGVTNFLSGKKLYSRNPDTQAMEPTGGFTTPSITYKDPAAFSVFSEGFREAREAILDEASQLHVLIAGDASASGVSRQQAVNDFMTSLEPTKAALEALVRWLLSTVLGLALHFTGRAGELDAYRVRVQGRLTAVQPTSEEVKTALKLHEAGAISMETLRARAGVDDGDAEQAAITAEGITPALAMRILDRAPTWVGLQALALALPALGITPADVAAQREIDLAAPAPAVEAVGGDDAPPEDDPPLE